MTGSRAPSSRLSGLRLALLMTVAAVAAAGGSSAFAMSLRDAVELAVDSNPEIGAAIENRAATGFELQQALGLYAPRVDLEASTGAERLSTPARRLAGTADNTLLPTEVGVTVSYDLLDGGFRDSEKDRQAARLDGAALRVLERSEFIALQIAQQCDDALIHVNDGTIRVRDHHIGVEAFERAQLSNGLDGILEKMV